MPKSLAALRNHLLNTELCLPAWMSKMFRYMSLLKYRFYIGHISNESLHNGSLSLCLLYPERTSVGCEIITLLSHNIFLPTGMARRQEGRKEPGSDGACYPSGSCAKCVIKETLIQTDDKPTIVLLHWKYWICREVFSICFIRVYMDAVSTNRPPGLVPHGQTNSSIRKPRIPASYDWLMIPEKGRCSLCLICQANLARNTRLLSAPLTLQMQNMRDVI